MPNPAAERKEWQQFWAHADALLKKGYSEADIDKIWGGNFLRVLQRVESVARAR